MPLLQCIDCGAMVSDAAPACPSCGRPAWRPAAAAPPAQRRGPSQGAQAAQAIGAIVALASLPTCAIAESGLLAGVMFLAGCAIFGIARLASV